MKIVFFGTPDYVMPVLTAIHKEFVTGPGKSPISAVVTQRPRPVGRKQVLAYSPVDKWAHDHKIPMYYSASDLLEKPVDATLGILASYGEIIRKDVIDLFPQGILVIHPSLLPKYRGASPVPAAIANGDTVTGISIIKMDGKMDHGQIVCQSKENIETDDNSETLRARLFEKSAKVLIEMLDPYILGKIKLKKQNDEEASFTKLMTKQDGYIDIDSRTPEETERFIRAMLPWPGTWTFIRLTKDDTEKQRIKLLKAHVDDGKLILDEVQLEGKDAVTWKQFMDGYKEATFVAAA